MRSAMLVAACSFIAAATTAQAQTIAGTVRDTTGALMPGVTVEAASPALIEKLRSVVTDGTGQYKIVSLSPGTYTVTFALAGFGTVKREGIVLTTDFTATINAELKVGTLEESITVTGESPLVDMQSATKQTVLSRAVLDELPAARSIQGAGALIPGVTMAATVGGGRDVGGSTKLQQPGLTFHGDGGTIQRWDGFWLSNVQGTGTGGATSFYVNDAGAQELVYSTGAEQIDMSAPGLYVNMIPKDGGNTFHGVVYGDFIHKGWQASNLGPDLTAVGLTNVAQVYHISDFNPGIGGPIRKDKLWYFLAYRYEAIDQTVIDSYYDKNVSPFVYVPDPIRPGEDDGKIPNQSLRVTYQASNKDKLQGWFTNQNKYRSHYNISASRTPSATSLQNTPYAQATTVKWTRTQSNRLLIEGGFARGRTLYQELYQPSVSPSSDQATVESVTIYSITDIANGKVFKAYDNGYSGHGGDMQNGRLGATYVTGAHAVRVGVMLGHATSPSPNWYTGDITMTFNNAVPTSITKRIPSDQSWCLRGRFTTCGATGLNQDNGGNRENTFCMYRRVMRRRADDRRRLVDRRARGRPGAGAGARRVDADPAESVDAGAGAQDNLRAGHQDGNGPVELGPLGTGGRARRVQSRHAGEDQAGGAARAGGRQRLARAFCEPRKGDRQLPVRRDEA